MRAATLALAFLCAFKVTAARAEDEVKAGTLWKGVIKNVSVSQKTKKASPTKTSDVVLKVTMRQDQKFAAEFWENNEGNGLMVEGVINDKGVAKFTAVSKIKGSWPGNVVGLWQHTGAFRGKRYQGKAILPAASSTGSIRVSEVSLSLRD